MDGRTDDRTNYDCPCQGPQNPPSAVGQIHGARHDSTGGQQGQQRPHDAGDHRDDARHGNLKEDHAVNPARRQSEASKVRSKPSLSQAFVPGQCPSHNDRDDGEQPGRHEGRGG